MMRHRSLPILALAVVGAGSVLAAADQAAAVFRNPFKHVAEVRFLHGTVPPQLLVVRDGDTGRPIQGQFEDEGGSFWILPDKSVTFSCQFDELGEFAVDATCTVHFRVTEGNGERRSRHYVYSGNRHYAKGEAAVAHRGWIEPVTSETKDQAWAAPVHIGAVKTAPDFIFLNRAAGFGPDGAAAESKGQAEVPSRASREGAQVAPPMASAPAAAADRGPGEPFEETKAQVLRRMGRIATQYHRHLDQDLLPSGHPRHGLGAGAASGPGPRRQAPRSASAPAASAAGVPSAASGGSAPAALSRPVPGAPRKAPRPPAAAAAPELSPAGAGSAASGPATPAPTPGGRKTFGRSQRPLPAPAVPVSPITSRPLLPARRFAPRLKTIESGKKLSPARPDGGRWDAED
jgi:hypothetical protein